MSARMMLLPALAALLAIGCGSEDQLRRVEQEVGDLKLEVFKLRQSVEEGNKKAQADQQAAAEARTQDRRFQADLQESLRQVQDTTRVLNNRLNSQPKGPSRPAAEPQAAAAAAEDERAYNAAVLDYNRGNYPLAAEGLELFLKTYPQSVKRPDALFFLGLCHYNQRAFDKAQAAFDRIIKEHAASPQFLPARLKRAQCLLKQGLKPAALKAFRELVDGFPGSAEARTAQQELSDLGL
ncbi:MAG: tetratricopeptide repeat protein [Geothrix sp.]|jgi:tol-pal system protein YbgF|uniref:Tetratricopeptide repeat protein n=1 Tax=Candidatus Geothrix odensensis TaxID=2954440 RepID=A0A936K4X4_9BACT|nr:tetratricopeptide repeat protein [Candidatus Geothrix odensensis]MCC6512443.1 tetratricopeptide repeat protein [Geothrix sp.]